MSGDPNSPVNPEGIEVGDYITFESIGGRTNKKNVRLLKVTLVNNELGLLICKPAPQRIGYNTCYEVPIRKYKLFKKRAELNEIQVKAISEAMSSIR